TARNRSPEKENLPFEGLGIHAVASVEAFSSPESPFCLSITVEPGGGQPETWLCFSLDSLAKLCG
ncbi:MAG: hypothetical protein ACXWR1_22200, partial [Bdellovibrionota bacterium]